MLPGLRALQFLFKIFRGVPAIAINNQNGPSAARNVCSGSRPCEKTLCVMIPSLNRRGIRATGKAQIMVSQSEALT